MGYDFKISTCICRWKVSEKEGGKEGKREGVHCAPASKGSEVKVVGTRQRRSKGLGSGKYMKRRATDWETGKEKKWRESREEKKGVAGKGWEKVWGPRELYLWRRVVMLENSPGRICMVFNEEGGAQWWRITKKKKEKNILLLIPCWEDKLFQAGTQRYHFSSPSLLLFYPGKGYADKKIQSFEDCLLPTTIICLWDNSGYSTSDLEAYG